MWLPFEPYLGVVTGNRIVCGLWEKKERSTFHLTSNKSYLASVTIEVLVRPTDRRISGLISPEESLWVWLISSSRRVGQLR